MTPEEFRRYGHAVVDRIADDPTCGRPREVFLRNMRSLPHEKHLIFFLPVRIGAGRAAVLRIVHQSRNLSALAYADDLDG